MKVFKRKVADGITNGDIVITIPKKIDWSEYEEELEKAKNGEIMNFKVPTLPTKTKVGNRCYLCYNGNIIGYMIVCGLSKDGFVCTTTGKKWEGNFVQRSGEFFKLDEPIPYAGFQGYRYFK